MQSRRLSPRYNLSKKSPCKHHFYNVCRGNFTYVTDLFFFHQLFSLFFIFHLHSPHIYGILILACGRNTSHNIIWLHGQAVKTLASHAGIRGSIPLGVTFRSFKNLVNIGFWNFFCCKKVQGIKHKIRVNLGKGAYESNRGWILMKNLISLKFLIPLIVCWL